MKVGGSFANDADRGAGAPVDRSRVGDGLATLNRKVVERLRATDGELRARIRKEALKNSGAPHFIDTRGPDLGLYTVDGMVLGGLMGRSGQGASLSPTPPLIEVSQYRDSARADAPGGAPKPQGQPAAAPSAGEAGQMRAVAAYSPARGSSSGAAVPVGVNKDLKV